jgi:integrase
MARPRKEHRIKLQGHRAGHPFFDLIIDSKKYRLSATDQEAAAVEGAALCKQIILERDAQRATRAAPGPRQPALKPEKGSLREAVSAYLGSDTFALYKKGTVRQRRSMFDLIMLSPASSGRHVLGDSLLVDWLHGPDSRDAVLRIMAACGDMVEAARRRLIALDQFFRWLLSDEPHAAVARVAFRIDARTARNPCKDIEPPTRKRSKGDGAMRRGHMAFTNEQVHDWLEACRDDLEQHRAVRLLQITGARISDLHRLNRGMIKKTAHGRVLTYIPTKGDDSAFRDGRPYAAVIPLVPELAALIDELPADRFTFIHSDFDRPYQSAASFGNRVRKWRREAGLPEGLSAHGMRKAATHWWLRNHRDLIPNNFALKTIFGWVTEKELIRYTRDFDREAEAVGMLIKLNERRKAS